MQNEPDLELMAEKIAKTYQGDLEGAIAMAKCQDLPSNLVDKLIALIKRFFNDQIPVMDDEDKDPKIGDRVDLGP